MCGGVLDGNPASEIILFQGNNHDGNSLIHREVWLVLTPQVDARLFFISGQNTSQQCAARGRRSENIYTVSEMTF